MGILHGMTKRLSDTFRSLRTIERELEMLRNLNSLAYRDSVLRSDPRYADPRHLTRHGSRVYSKSDEDGIIAEILRRVGVGEQYFVEFGVEGGLQNNTLALLLQGWKGGWIEADGEASRAIKQHFRHLIDNGRLTTREAFVTAENIERLFEELGVPGEFGVLSIDIDGNDYWVWKAITRYRPRVVVIEYNRWLGPSIDAKMRYDPQWRWKPGTRAYGASLKAMEKLGRDKGYSLVGATFYSGNAFFVNEDLAGDVFAAPYTSEQHYEAPKQGSKRRVSYDEIGAFFW